MDEFVRYAPNFTNYVLRLPEDFLLAGELQKELELAAAMASLADRRASLADRRASLADSTAELANINEKRAALQELARSIREAIGDPN